jgi:imidazolonepropionase
MAASGTVAVLLPGAFVTLGETQLPPIAAMREHHVPIAVASDCNPGTSPICSLRTAMMLAARVFRLTPEECLAGVTREAARALGLDDRGTLEVGKRADLAVWDIAHPRELAYWFGTPQLAELLVAGQTTAT